MDTVDLNCSSSSASSNESATLPPASFYGKNKNDYPLVKIKKLPASVIEYYLGKPPSEDKDEFKPKLSRAKRKLVPVIGSDATRHNIKPLSAKKRKQNEKMKRSKEIVLEDNSEEENCHVIEENRRNPRRKAAIDGFIKMKRASNAESLSITKLKSASNNQVTHEVRKNPSRKAAVETSEKITKAYKDMEDTEDFDDTSYYSESSFSSSSDDVVKKPSKVKVDQHENIPKPEFSEYEKAAQEKVALRKDFLKSLNIHSFDEK